MFKITCFAPVPPEKLGKLLKGLRFNKTKDGFKWELDGHVFIITPFKNHGRGKEYGYRVHFNQSVEGGAYLMDNAFGWIDTKVTGIECTIPNESTTRQEHIKDFIENKPFKLVDARGLFRKDRIVIVVTNEEVNLQIRSSKSKGLNLIPALTEISDLRKDITVEEYNLFTLQNEELTI